MKSQKNATHIINSISELHRLLTLAKPGHPLVSVINLPEVRYATGKVWEHFILNFYCIALKKEFHGKVKYGQNYYDFDEGIMTFTSPGQVLSLDPENENTGSGYMLVFHPDFIRNYPLGKTIKGCGFFSYTVNEALHLSEKEEITIEGLLKHIEQEYLSTIDLYSQNVILSHIELLLNYSERFYNRQFITRKNGHNDLLTKVETLLSDYFNDSKVQESGLPTVEYLSTQLHISSNYLSDMLRTLTGQNAQQHIHHFLIEKAKEILTTTNLSVNEIAYQLGFEYPQSFSRLFRNKTNVSPLAFRRSFL